MQDVCVSSAFIGGANCLVFFFVKLNLRKVFRAEFNSLGFDRTR